MNGFEQHEIRHLSPSSINLWINAPDRWVVEKLYGRRGKSSPSAHRGIAIERAVVDVLRGESFEAAVNAGLEQFDESVLIGDQRTERERQMISPTVDQLLDLLAGFGEPEFDGEQQIRVQRDADLGEAGSIKFIGYLDLVFPGAVVDIKTVSKMPSKMSIEHQRQRAFYAACTRKDVAFAYATPKKAEFKSDGDDAKLLAEMKWHASRLERLLRDRTREEIAALVPVNTNSFYWSGCEADAEEIFGKPKVA